MRWHSLLLHLGDNQLHSLVQQREIWEEKSPMPGKSTKHFCFAILYIVHGGHPSAQGPAPRWNLCSYLSSHCSNAPMPEYTESPPLPSWPIPLCMYPASAPSQINLNSFPNVKGLCKQSHVCGYAQWGRWEHRQPLLKYQVLMKREEMCSKTHNDTHLELSYSKDLFIACFCFLPL